jgi:hypothetical protein
MLTGAWLLALVVTGIPLFALFGSDAAEDDPGDPGSHPPDETSQETITDEAAPRAVEGRRAEGQLPPTDYEFILDTGGDHAIDSFRTGTDTLTLTSGDWDFDIYDLGRDPEGAALRIDRITGKAIIRFPGLDELPKEDIHLKVAEPGEEFLRVALLDALCQDDAGVMPLLPTDPDATDAPPDDASLPTPLAPAAPEEKDVPPDPAEATAVLLPVAPDAPEDAGRRS